MIHSIQRNFLFLWVMILLGIALVLSLTFAGCASKTLKTASSQTNIPTKGKATSVLCIDSDNGINTSVKGSVTFQGNETKDLCIGPFLVEYYCEGNLIANQNIKCNCSKGKCN